MLNRHEAAQSGTASSQNITINIQTRDAESFRQSRTQVLADIARAVAMERLTAIPRADDLAAVVHSSRPATGGSPVCATKPIGGLLDL